jgi:hypothetical protein
MDVTHLTKPIKTAPDKKSYSIERLDSLLDVERAVSRRPRSRLPVDARRAAIRPSAAAWLRFHPFVRAYRNGEPVYSAIRKTEGIVFLLIDSIIYLIGLWC